MNKAKILCLLAGLIIFVPVPGSFPLAAGEIITIEGDVILNIADGIPHVILTTGDNQDYRLLSGEIGENLETLAGKRVLATGLLISEKDLNSLVLSEFPVVLESIDSSDPASENRRPVIHLANRIVLVTEQRSETDRIESESLKSRNVGDLAEALADDRIEIQMIRKSGYGNEVSMRGFGQENLKVLLDGNILEGACGSRKDPALSHINILMVEGFNIQQGPFDVTKPGALGGYVDVTTRKPGMGFGGELLAKGGSYGYYSGGSLLEGGKNRLQGLFGFNYSESGQYEDGKGRALWEAREGLAADYLEKGRTAKAFSKNDLWGKLRFAINDRQTLLLEHIYGKADNILTPRVAFDTRGERTNLSKLSWEIRGLHDFSERMTLSAFQNSVEHYPFQGLRDVAVPKDNRVKSTIGGGGIRNVTKMEQLTLTLGYDLYHRDWRGDVYNSLTGAVLNDKLIPSVKTLNLGSYIQADRFFNTWSLSAGFRFDRFRQRADEALAFSGSVTEKNLQVDYLKSGFIFVNYFPGGDAVLFGGLGRSYRPPTSTERYIQGNPSYFGNPELRPAANTELDAGIRISHGPLNFQAKGFYSNLEDYIYQERNRQGYSSYTNIDAHIYGGDIRAEIKLTRKIFFDAGFALQRGIKDTFPDNNNDRDLGQIAPLKSRMAIRYNGDRPQRGSPSGLSRTVEWVHSGAAENIDRDAGEQFLPEWDVLNIRLGYSWKAFTLNIGAENIINSSYAVANSYEWDVVGGSGSNPAVVFEPGRSIYTSLGFRW